MDETYKDEVYMNKAYEEFIYRALGAITAKAPCAYGRDEMSAESYTDELGLWNWCKTHCGNVNPEDPRTFAPCWETCLKELYFQSREERE